MSNEKTKQFGIKLPFPKTLLIVEDEPEIRAILRAHLEASVQKIVEAADGKTALQFIATEKPDIIISDYNMPGMNGLELLRTLKELKTQIPVIWTTGYASRELFREAWRAGVYDFFEKPFNLEQVVDCVRGALNSGPQQNNYAISSLCKVGYSEFPLIVEKELLKRIQDHCAKSGTSLTTLLVAFIQAELNKAG
jgi:DNA-binding NtrC family response regulator